MLEVITGGMFAGKTDELIRRLERHSIARRRVALVKTRPGHANNKGKNP